MFNISALLIGPGVGTETFDHFDLFKLPTMEPINCTLPPFSHNTYLYVMKDTKKGPMICGGEVERKCTADCWLLSKDNWDKVEPWQENRCEAGSVMFEGHWLVAGS